MGTLYRRTQAGTAIVAFVLVALAGEAVLAWIHGWSPVLAVVFVVLSACGITFSTMTIEVTDDGIAWWLTFGILRQRVSMPDIQSAVTRRVTLLNGLGIRTDGRNSLWIVGGSEAVELTLLDGRRIALGSPDAEQVATLLNDLRRRPQYQG